MNTILMLLSFLVGFGLTVVVHAKLNLQRFNPSNQLVSCAGVFSSAIVLVVAVCIGYSAYLQLDSQLMNLAIFLTGIATALHHCWGPTRKQKATR